jgi:hypothetical protein
MLPGHPHRVVVASLNICRWGVGCHAQTGRECQSYDPGDSYIGYRTEEHDLRKESSGSSGLALTIEVAA